MAEGAHQNGQQLPAESAARHFRRPVEHPFTEEDRRRVTLLHCGLTARHGALISAAVQGLGYKCESLPLATKADFQAGKEYGSTGMCNPAHFMAGALVNYLKRLRDEQGLSTREILASHAFVTAGSCGPCRFGMFEHEYRLALRNAGFEGFRVLLFQQRSLNQRDPQSGLHFDLYFALALFNAFVIGDVLNDVACRVRPYEVVPGATDRLFAEALEGVAESLRTRDYPRSKKGEPALRLYLDQMMSGHYVRVLRHWVRRLDEEVEVDYTKPRPLVKIGGEFYAQTTEGDGNFRMFTYLEDQGAEVWVEPLTTWVSYLLNQAHGRAVERGAAEAPPWWRLPARLGHATSLAALTLRLRLGHWMLQREYSRYREAFGGLAHPQPPQETLRQLATPYYNWRLTGGEGHLEVGKALYYGVGKKAHLVLGLKPFNCMPSTQSDGVMAAVMGQHPELHYAAIETSGEGDVNAYSRALLALSDADAACREEFNAAVAKTGYSLEQIRRYCAGHREYRRPFQHLPQREGVAGTAANFVLHVGEQMRKAGEKV